MKKIIVKCKLKNHDNFEQKLSEIDMDFGPLYWQHDRVYVPREYKKRSNYPRLIMRTEMHAVDRPARYELILKRHIEDSGVDIVDVTSVKDYVEAVNIVQQLGFKLRAEVSRRRQEIKMGEGTILYCDKVDNMPGFYAKIETILEENDKVHDVKEELKKTFLTLDETDVIEENYADIMNP